MKLYRLAAEQNYPPAETHLGGMYQNGKGVPQDAVEAVRLYRRAADQGDSFAQNNLGVMYATGQAVPQDYVQAYMWFSISLAQGNGTSANNRERAASLMTPAQIAEAEKLAQRMEAKFRAALDRYSSRCRRTAPTVGCRSAQALSSLTRRSEGRQRSRLAGSCRRPFLRS